MPVRVLSDAELARLSSWPGGIADDDLVAFFTLTNDDVGWLGSNIRLENRLGAARYSSARCRGWAGYRMT